MAARVLAKIKNAAGFWVVFLIGVFLRIAWVILVDTVPVSDYLEYHNSAISIMQGNGYRLFGYTTAFRPIGYPAFLAFLYKLFTPSVIVAKVANIVLSCMSMVFTYLMAKHVLSKKAAVAAMLFMALSPKNIAYTSVMANETLFTALLLALNYLLIRQFKGKAFLVLQGILMGVLALIKPNMLVYPFVAFLIDVFSFRESIKACIKRLIAVSLIMAVVICPWTIRNFIVFRKFIPVSTNAGYVLYINNNPHATGMWQDPFKIQGSPLVKYKHVSDEFFNEIQVDRVGRAAAFKWIIENPGDFVKLGFIRLQKTFWEVDDTYWATAYLQDGNPYKYANTVSHITVKANDILRIFLLAYVIILLAEIWKKMGMSDLNRIILLNLAYFSSIVFVFEGQPRYAFPTIPFFILAAGYVISVAENKVRNHINDKQVTKG